MKTSLKSIFFFMLAVLAVGTSCKKKMAPTAVVTETAKETEPVEKKKTFGNINFQELGEPLMVYERTVCFGKCPVFIFTIYNNGFATYEGKQNVEKIGFYGAELPRTDIDELKKAIFEGKYFDMEELYHTPKVTDIPTVYTTVTIENKRKKIVAKAGYPEELRNIHRLLDRFIKYVELTEIEKPKGTKE
jgi:Domain of unknown function (DUF6438)